MDEPMSTIGFRLMTIMFKIRDTLKPRINVLNEAGIKSGFRVLDFGCGPGSYIRGIAQLVGTSGEIYALDIHPLSIEKVRKIAAQKGLTNVKTVKSDCDTGLPNSHIDVVLLYDIFHDLSQPDEVLHELHRVLKPDGRLSFSDHHMKDADIVTGLSQNDGFQLSTKGKMTYTFSKTG